VTSWPAHARALNPLQQHQPVGRCSKVQQPHCTAPTVYDRQSPLTWPNEAISAVSVDVAVLEMGEDERGPGDVADLAGAGGDVLQGAPAAGEQRESAFAQAA